MATSSLSGLSFLHSMDIGDDPLFYSNSPILDTRSLFMEIFSFLSKQDSQSASKGLQRHFLVMDLALPYQRALYFPKALSEHIILEDSHQVSAIKERKKGLGALLIGLHGEDLALNIFSLLDAQSLSVNARVSSACNKMGKRGILWNTPKWLHLFSRPEFSFKKKWLTLNPGYIKSCSIIRNQFKTQARRERECVFYQQEHQIEYKKMYEQIAIIGGIFFVVLCAYLSGFSSQDLALSFKVFDFVKGYLFGALPVMGSLTVLSLYWGSFLEKSKILEEKAHKNLSIHFIEVKIAIEERRDLDKNRLKD